MNSLKNIKSKYFIVKKNLFTIYLKKKGGYFTPYYNDDLKIVKKGTEHFYEGKLGDYPNIVIHHITLSEKRSILMVEITVNDLHKKYF